MLKDLRLALFIASRSIARSNRKSTLFVILIMTLLVINIILLPSLMDEMDRVTRSQIVDKHLGHVLVEPEEGEEYISGVAELKSLLLSFPEVVGVSAQYLMPVVLFYDDQKRAGMVYFIDPSEESFTTDKAKDIIMGEFLSKKDTCCIVLGAEAAGVDEAVFKHISLGVRDIGEAVNVSYREGLWKEYKVKGIFQTKLVEADWDAYLTMEELKSLFGIEDRATQLIVRLEAEDIEKEFISRAVQMGVSQSLKVTKEQQGLVLTETLDLIKNIAITVSVIVSVATLFIITYINAVNKKKVIAIIKSIGLKRRAIVTAFVLESVFFTACGAALGIMLLYLFFVPYFQSRPLDLPFAFVSLRLRPAAVIFNISLLMLSSVIAGAVPVLQITREKIVDVLRE